MEHVLTDNGVLNLGGGVVFKIPMWYDDLAKTGDVPRYVHQASRQSPGSAALRDPAHISLCCLLICCLDSIPCFLCGCDHAAAPGDFLQPSSLVGAK